MARSEGNTQGGGHGIRIPGALLDQIRTREDNSLQDNHSQQKTFKKKRKQEGALTSRKERRKLDRKLKKQNHGKRSQGGNDKENRESKASANGGDTKGQKILAEGGAKKNVKVKSNEPNGTQHGTSPNGLTEYDGSNVKLEGDLEEEFYGFDDDEQNFSENSHYESEDQEIAGSGSEEDESHEELEMEENPLEKLKAIKEAKKKGANEKQRKASNEPKKGSDNENEDVMTAKDDVFGQFSETENEDEELEMEENPLEKLKAIKEAKNGIPTSKSAKRDFQKKDQEASERKKERILTSYEREMMKKDEEEMEYYAKKLGMKDGKKSKLSKQDDNDVIGGLLDGLGLEFFEPSDIEENGDAKKSKNEKKHEHDFPVNRRKHAEDDGDFSEDELRELREMEELEDDDSDEESSSDENASNSSEGQDKVKENPFLPPVEIGQEENDGEESLRKYVPPALRRKLENVTHEDYTQLRRTLKGSLNKLAVSNIGSILDQINGLYFSNPRHAVNENMTLIVLDSIINQMRLSENFVYLHAALVVGLYRLQGVDFGAFFVQTVVEKFEEYHKSENKKREALHTISLLSSVYMFQLISSRLIYDIIAMLIENLDEFNAELMLSLLRSSGNQIRSEDPASLKDIILMLTQKTRAIPSQNLTPRTQFLIETIMSLKNNKLKIQNESNYQLSLSLKKFLGARKTSADPIRVSLREIHSIDTQGKWWLVGSAWKGEEPAANSEPLVDKEAMNDILLSSEPNWMELARSQRMNTDVRRAIFVSIMSAEDYVDAMTKLDKLTLKRSQEREIPVILIHCASMEPNWNPYYGVLASKLSASHSHRKTFQFIMWDITREFEGSKKDESDDDDNFLSLSKDIEDEEGKMRKVLNLGRFFGYLFSEGCLHLHTLRVVNFLGGSQDLELFMEVLVLSFLDGIAKKSQMSSFGAGLSSPKDSKMFESKFDDKVLLECVMRAKDEEVLLKGLDFFLQNKLAHSDFITGKKQKRRIQWGIGAMHDIISELISVDHTRD